MALGYLVSPVIQVEDINGKPLVGGFIRVYRHGTTDPYITHRDFDGDLNPDEVVLDARGMCILLAEEGNLYDIYCEDRDRVEQWSRVNVPVVGAGGGSGDVSISSSDGSITVIRTGNSFDIKVSRDGSASALVAFSAIRTTDGDFEFVCTPVNSVGNDLKVANRKIVATRHWYHYDATVALDWRGTPVNLTRDIAITGPANSEHMDFDLSYAHVESIDLSGDLEIAQSGTPVTFAVQGLPEGMRAQVVNASVHALVAGGSGGGGGGGDMSEVVHDNTLSGDGTLESPLGVNPEWMPTDISSKADKVSGAVNGDLAALDSNGNLVDSGVKPSDFASSAQGSVADTAIQGLKVNGSTVAPDSDRVVSITVPPAVTVDPDYSASSHNAQAGTAVAQAIDLVRQVPVASSADNGKVLSVIDSNGTVGWASEQDMSGKADKVSGATNGDLAGLDSNGNLVDSGVKPSDFATAAQGTKADTAVQPGDLATVATSGSYSDLSNKPSIPAAQVNADWNAVSGVSQILNKPSLATVATTGNYNDLTNKPTIPDAQVNADWSSVSGVSEILHKPELRNLVAGTGVSITESGNDVTISSTVYTFLNGLTEDNGRVYVTTPIPDRVSSDSGKVLGVTNTSGTVGWVSLEGKVDKPQAVTYGDFASLDNYGNIYDSGKRASDFATAAQGTKADSSIQGVKVNGSTVTPDSSNVVDITVPSAMTVDQSYNSASTNAQSGTAVAQAIGGVRQVSTITSSDNGKVLKASYNNGSTSYSWQQEGGGSSSFVDQTYDATSTNAQSGTAVAEALATVNAVPAATSGDNGKVLGVTNSSGAIGWVSAGGSELPSLTGHGGQILKVNSGATDIEWADNYTAGNMVSISNNAVSVSTTAGITDIQVVADLPANPVATVLYLIPAT